MRRAIDRWLTPTFEAIVRRFDPTVELGDHLAFLTKLPERVPHPDSAVDAVLAPCLDAALEQLGCGGIDGDSVAPPRFVRWSPAAIQSPHGAEIGALVLDATLALPELPRIELDPSSLGAGPFDWLEDPEPARRAAWTALAATACDAPERDRIDALLLMLVDGFEPRQWFIAKRGVVYGSSALLRALIAQIHAGAAGDDLHAYTREVLDRLLKHVEVRREEALRLCGGAPEGASHELERIRFAFALLEGSRATNDLRLLNAALKRNDFHLGELARKDRTRDVRWWAELTQYASCLALQERRFEEAFPR